MRKKINQPQNQNKILSRNPESRRKRRNSWKHLSLKVFLNLRIQRKRGKRKTIKRTPRTSRTPKNTEKEKGTKKRKLNESMEVDNDDNEPILKKTKFDWDETITFLLSKVQVNLTHDLYNPEIKGSVYNVILFCSG